MARSILVVAAAAASLAAGAVLAALPVGVDAPPTKPESADDDAFVFAPLESVQAGHVRAEAFLRADKARRPLLDAASRVGVNVLRVQCDYTKRKVERRVLGPGRWEATSEMTSHTNYGSAVVVGPREVLTARHIFESDAPDAAMSVLLADGTHVPATILAGGADDDPDYAGDWMLLEVAKDAPPLPQSIEMSKVVPMSYVVALGFGDEGAVAPDGRIIGVKEGEAGTPTWSVGQVYGATAMRVNLVAGGLPVGGASGGPVIDESGRLVGVVVGWTQSTNYVDLDGGKRREAPRLLRFNVAPILGPMNALRARTAKTR